MNKHLGGTLLCTHFEKSLKINVCKDLILIHSSWWFGTDFSFDHIDVMRFLRKKK